MIFSELRDYLQLRHRASLMDMAHHFDVDAEALRGMLGKLIAKGRIDKLPADETPCGGCCKCDATRAEIYQWRN